MLSPREIAQMLGVSTQTVYRRLHSGVLPGYRLAGSANPPLRVDPEDLAAYLHSNVTRDREPVAA